MHSPSEFNACISWWLYWQVLFAEHLLFEDWPCSQSLYFCLWIINVVLDTSRFREPTLSFVPHLVYLSVPNCGTKSCPPKDTTCETCFYETGSMLNITVWVCVRLTRRSGMLPSHIMFWVLIYQCVWVLAVLCAQHPSNLINTPAAWVEISKVRCK